MQADPSDRSVSPTPSGGPSPAARSSAEREAGGPERHAPRTATGEWFAFGMLAAAALAAVPLTLGAGWGGGAASHAAMEPIASTVALMAGLAALVRYFSRPAPGTLILAAAFLLVGLLDGYNALVSGTGWDAREPAEAAALSTWVWLLSRATLGAFLIARVIPWGRVAGAGRVHPAGRVRVSGVGVFVASSAAVVIGIAILLSLVRLPPARADGPLLNRPWELAAAALFAAAAVLHVRRPDWHRRPLERWVVASLALGVLCQTAVIPLARAPWDAWGDLAHVLKILSYACVGIGLMFDVYVLLNLTERTKARLEHEQMLFEQLASNIPDAIFFKDVDGRFIRVNSALARMVGAGSEDELIGKTDFDWFPAVQAEQFRADDARIMTTGRPLINNEERLTTPGGTFHTLTTKMPLQDADGVVLGVFGVTRDITDRVRAEEKLHDATEQLELALQCGNVGLWDWNLITSNVYYSPELKAQVGLAPEAPLEAYDDWEQRLHPEDRDATLRKLQDYLAGRIDVYDPTFRLQHADGSYRWVFSRGKLFRDARGRPCRMIGVHLDMTEQVLAEQRLQQFARRLALPPPEFDADAIRCRLDHLTLTDMMACGAAIRKLGAESRSVRGFARRLVRLLHARVATGRCPEATVLVRFMITERWDALAPELRERGELPGHWPPGEAICLRNLATAGRGAAGREAAAEGSVVPLACEEEIDAQPLVRELLDQLRIDRAALFAETPRIAFRGDSPKVVFIPEAEAHPLLLDPGRVAGELGVRSIVGFGDLLPTGQLFVVLLYCRPEVWAETAQLLSHFALSTRMALLSLLAIDSVVPAKVQALDELLANHERIVAQQESDLEATLHQLLQSKAAIEEANAELRRRSADLSRSNAELDRRNQELDDFAHVASHDLRAPLRAIFNLARWIEEDSGDRLPQPASEHLEKLQQRVARMERLLEDLLQYSRVGRRKGDLDWVDPEQIVRDLIELHSQLGAFTFHVDGPLPRLETYRVPLEQVLRNLISNAIQHHDRDAGNIWIAARDAEDMVEFIIRDDGPGIDPKYHDRVFRMFQTLQPRDRVEASGIGLAIVKKLVDSEGGRIWIEPTPGRGSCFHFLWPKHSTPTPAEI